MVFLTVEFALLPKVTVVDVSRPESFVANAFRVLPGLSK